MEGITGSGKRKRVLSELLATSSIIGSISNYMNAMPREYGGVITRGSNRNAAKLKSKRKQIKKSKQVNRK